MNIQTDIDSIFNPDTSMCLDEFGQVRAELYEEYRPTVAVALMCGNQVLLVQSSKRCGNEGKSWLFPQGGIDPGKTIFHALSMELWQELGLEFTLKKLLELQETNALAALGWYINPPRFEGKKPKLIIVVGIQVESLDPITLNEENTKYQFVYEPYMLWAIMGTTRQAKVAGTLYALYRAHMAGLIGWSCRDVLSQAVATA